MTLSNFIRKTLFSFFSKQNNMSIQNNLIVCVVMGCWMCGFAAGCLSSSAQASMQDYSQVTRSPINYSETFLFITLLKGNSAYSKWCGKKSGDNTSLHCPMMNMAQIIRPVLQCHPVWCHVPHPTHKTSSNSIYVLLCQHIFLSRDTL